MVRGAASDRGVWPPATKLKPLLGRATGGQVTSRASSASPSVRHGVRDRLLLFATSRYGLRVNEAVALHRAELELDHARLWVRRLRGGLSVPCPATGKVGHRCLGFIRDPFIPLCAGGADAVGNLWWEEVGRAAEKDRHELQLCHQLRGIERHGDDPALRQRAIRLYLRNVQALRGDEAGTAGRQAF